MTQAHALHTPLLPWTHPSPSYSLCSPSFASEHQNTAAIAIFAVKLFSEQFFSERPSPSNSPRLHPPYDVTRRPRASPGDSEPSPTSPTSSSSAPTTGHRGQPPSANF